MDPILTLWQQVADELLGLRDDLVLRQQKLADKQLEIVDLEDAVAAARIAEDKLSRRVARRQTDFEDTQGVAEVLAKRDDVDPILVADYIDAVLVEPEIIAPLP